MVKFNIAFFTPCIAVADPFTTHAFGPKIEIGARIPLKHDINRDVSFASDLFEAVDPFSNSSNTLLLSLFFADLLFLNAGSTFDASLFLQAHGPCKGQ